MVLFIAALSCCTTDDAVLKIITVCAFVLIASLLGFISSVFGTGVG